MTEVTQQIEVGDTIRSRAMGDNPAFDVKVLRIEDCDGAAGAYSSEALTAAEGGHPAYVVNDPETGEEDTVCSRDFVLVSKGAPEQTQPDGVVLDDGSAG